jgi:hypothetical protein
MSGEHTHPEIGALDTELARLNTAVARLTAQVVALEAAPPTNPPGTAGTPGVVEVDSFPGATDDDKLAAALAHAAAQTNKPTIRFRHGKTTLTRTVVAFTGMRLLGAGGGVAVEQPRGGNPYSTLIDWRGTDPAKPWLLWPSGQTFGTFVGHMAIQGTATSTIIGAASSSAVAWRSVFRDLGMANMAHAIGSPTAKFLMTACTWDGDWNINNIRGAYGIRIGGSDNAINTGTLLLDSPTSLNANVAAHLWCDYLEKTDIRGLYITAEGTPAGVRVTGNAGTEPVTFWAPRVEGRNAGQPCKGPVIRIEGGDVNIIAPWLAYSLTETVRVTGGDVLIDAPTFGRATNTPSTAPAVAQTGGVLRVVNARRSPLVTRTGGTLTHDGTIRTA